MRWKVGLVGDKTPWKRKFAFWPKKVHVTVIWLEFFWSRKMRRGRIDGTTYWDHEYKLYEEAFE